MRISRLVLAAATVAVCAAQPVVTVRGLGASGGTEGPFRLIAPGEKRGGRAVHRVTGLTVKQAN